MRMISNLSALKFTTMAATALFLSTAVVASGTTNYNSAGSGSSSSTSAPKAAKLTLNTLQVQLIQSALRDLGHNPGAIDGQWGPSSARAVQAYQASINKPATGALNVETACDLIQIGTALHGSAGKIPSWCGFS